MQETQDNNVRPDRADFSLLLSDRNQHPERADEIDKQICQVFERKVAILALDMCGFSRLTDQHGIIHFLAMIDQMVQATTPAVTGNGGQIIKHGADNLFAIFSHPVNALEAAIDIFRAFTAMNAVLPDSRDIYGSIGIGFGDTLVIEGEDLFGAEMNLASKLGEDLAIGMQVLFTPEAQAALPPDLYACARQTYVINSVEFVGYSFDRFHSFP